MNSQDIFDGVTDIQDDLISKAKEPLKRQRHGRRKRWLGAVAAVLALAIIGGVFLRPVGGLTAYAIAEAEYPEMAPYPGIDQIGSKAYEAWREDVAAQGRDLGDISPLQSFFAQSAQTFLAGAKGENRVYSPLNVYMALSMLAQLTGGESREQILTLLGSDSIDALRRQAGDVWNASYRDDGTVTSILANSLWLNHDVKFSRDTMNVLARDFYASSYQGEMGSDEFNRVLQGWLSEQTRGLLEEQAGNIELNRDTILALASTVCFQAGWSSEFSKDRTVSQPFHAPAGDVQADFMCQGSGEIYYWGDSFAAVGQSFERGGGMWFLLPGEGMAPEELLSDQETMDFLFAASKDQWEKQKFAFVNKAIPRFDVSSQFDLGEGICALGVSRQIETRQDRPQTAN